MSSRRRNTIKFIYTDDFGRDTLKIQRQEKLNGTDTPIVPITALFQTRILQAREKAETNFNGEQLRHVLAYANTENNNVGQFKQFIPFDQPPNISDMINEVLNLPEVICGDYKGESSGVQNSLNGSRNENNI